jgi:hypothetical protein
MCQAEYGCAASHRDPHKIYRRSEDCSFEAKIDSVEVRKNRRTGWAGELGFRLVQRLGVFILTDSYLRNTNLSYRVSSGETLWSILKKLHAGRGRARWIPMARREDCFRQRARVSRPHSEWQQNKAPLAWN